MMRSRSSPLWWIPLFVALLAFSGCGAPPQNTVEKPNVVLILSDDKRLDEFEYMPQAQRLLAEQGLTLKNAFVTRLTGKRTVYEEDVRVPLTLRGPGAPEGESVEEMVLNIDFAPTIAELASVSVPTFVDGRSLVPMLSGTQPADWRSAFLIEHWAGGDVGFRLAPTCAAIRTETDKYVEYDTGEQELYDLASDPYELESIPLARILRSSRA